MAITTERVTLSVVAVIEAANEALARSEQLQKLPLAFMKTGYWNFLPIILLGALFSAELWRFFFPKATNEIASAKPSSIRDTEISNARELVDYHDRVQHAWNECQSAFTNFVGSYEYVQDFLDQFEKDEKDPVRQEWFKRNFPGESLSAEDVAPLKASMVNDGNALRSALEKFAQLLHFRFR
jgi:hypothetical protein